MGNVKTTRNNPHPESEYIVSMQQLSYHIGGVGGQTLDQLLKNGLDKIRHKIIGTTLEYFLKWEVDEWIASHSEVKNTDDKTNVSERIQVVSTARARVRNK